MVERNFESKSEAMRFSQLEGISMTQNMTYLIDERAKTDKNQFKKDMTEKFGNLGEKEQFFEESVANLLGSIGISYGKLRREHNHMG